MRRRDFVAVGALSTIGLSLSPPRARAEQDDDLALVAVIEAVQVRLTSLMDEYSVPGLALALFRRGAIRLETLGRRDRSRPRAPVDEDTVFEAASMSKPVFAYAVMKLCERGVLNLDTPLTHYTSKRFLDGDPRLDAITARHVLSHTTGFQNWRSDQEPLAIHFAPGERFEYSGEGYSYLQSVVTELTGMPIEDYMQANVFGPFGMASSGYVWGDQFERNTATPHDSEGFPMVKKKPTPADAARYASAGDLHTTAVDYARASSGRSSIRSRATSFVWGRRAWRRCFGRRSPSAMRTEPSGRWGGEYLAKESSLTAATTSAFIAGRSPRPFRGRGS